MSHVSLTFVFNADTFPEEVLWMQKWVKQEDVHISISHLFFNKKSNFSIPQDPRFYQELDVINSDRSLKEVLWSSWPTWKPLPTLKIFSTCQGPRIVLTSSDLSGWQELGGRRGTHKNAPCYSQKGSTAGSPWLRMQRIVILSQSKHFPIWEAHWVTSSFWCRHHFPRELFVWRLWRREERSLSAKMPCYHIFASCNMILMSLGSSGYLGTLKGKLPLKPDSSWQSPDMLLWRLMK